MPHLLRSHLSFTLIPILIFIFFSKVNPILATNTSCLLEKSDITGVMQWNDGFPFTHYNRNSHCQSRGSCNDYQVVDVNGYYGSPIYSPVDGSIVHLKPSGGNQYNIIGMYKIGIKGDDNLFYGMAHVMQPSISLGDRVSAGQKIAHLISKEQAQADPNYQRICNLSQPSTTPECIKPHVHFDVYSGPNFGDPSSHGGNTLNFLSNNCDITRPPGDNSEFPHLPTLNCAKITGNPNINRCFMEKPTTKPICSKWTVTNNGSLDSSQNASFSLNAHDPDNSNQSGDGIQWVKLFYHKDNGNFKDDNWVKVGTTLSSPPFKTTLDTSSMSGDYIMVANLKDDEGIFVSGNPDPENPARTTKGCSYKFQVSSTPTPTTKLSPTPTSPSETPTPKPEDIDRDGDVDLIDLSLFVKRETDFDIFEYSKLIKQIFH